MGLSQENQLNRFDVHQNTMQIDNI
uniref:Uncharacterized protein n=1 Tax=Nelumbo nucifera TaxID=4432 RepID=A0A822ZCQ7_NELNU|nr:TPA_asm: hypothetical protein HUJ06_015119 [Nelumbo nucifera]